jgi:hypothetical protein
MFNGEESIRIRSNLSGSELEEVVEESLGRLGVVEFLRRGEFEVSGNKFSSFATDVRVTGQLSKARREGEWNLRVDYSVQPSAACWVIAVVGFFLCLVGPLILLVPFLAKSEVERAVGRAVRDARDDAEAPDEGYRSRET